MTKKPAPNYRQTNTCSNCKSVIRTKGEPVMQCKKYSGYMLADSICDDHEAFNKGKNWFINEDIAIDESANPVDS